MSDTSAGQPTTEPTGPPSAPASTDPRATSALEGVDSLARELPDVAAVRPGADATGNGGPDDTGLLSTDPASRQAASCSPASEQSPSARTASSARRRPEPPVGARPGGAGAEGASEGQGGDHGASAA